jgi:putative transposase
MSERRACKIVDLDRSSCRYEAKPNDDHVVIERIKEIVAERPRFGSPRVHLVLRNEGLVKNHKRTERLYYGLGLQLKKRKPKRRLYKPENPLPPPQHPNVRWSMDFVHDNLADGRSFRVLTIIDEFSRECPAMEVDLSLSGHRVVRVLDKLAATRGLPQEIGVDQGPEFTSKALTKWALANGVRLHYASPGDKNENAFIESFNGKLRDECLNMHWFSRLADAREIIEAWRIDYNEVRPHRSLKGLSPVQYRKSKELKLAA